MSCQILSKWNDFTYQEIWRLHIRQLIRIYNGHLGTKSWRPCRRSCLSCCCLNIPRWNRLCKNSPMIACVDGIWCDRLAHANIDRQLQNLASFEGPACSDESLLTCFPANGQHWDELTRLLNISTWITSITKKLIEQNITLMSIFFLKN